VKLRFYIKAQLDDGTPDEGGERMWVIVAEKHGDVYIGILDSDPHIANPAHLQRGAEIPFKAEHIIDLEDPPPEYAAKALASPRTEVWPRV
jgi:uncharacterized protein YegJ (DUF2314 family)